MKKLSVFLIAALFITLAVHSTTVAKADVELTINENCGCRTATPSPTPVPTQIPTPTPSLISQTPTSNNNSTPPNGNVGAPICTATTPANPIITSEVRKLTSETIT